MNYASKGVQFRNLGLIFTIATDFYYLFIIYYTKNKNITV